MKKKSLQTLLLNKKSISNLKNLQGQLGGSSYPPTATDCDIMETRLTFNYLCDDDGGGITEYNGTCGLNCGFPTFEPTRIGCD